MPALPATRAAGHLFTFITIAIWSVAFVGNKVLLSHITPIEVMLYRFSLAWGLMLLVAPLRGVIRSLREELYFLLLGFLGIFVYFLLENYALRYTQAANVGLYMGAIPILTALLAHFTVKNERFRLPLFLGFLVALTGMGLILFEGRHFELRLLGDLLALAAASVFALYSVLLKRAPAGYSPMLITRKSFFYAIVMMLLWQFLDDGPMHWQALALPVVAMNLLFLGLFASGVAFFSGSEALRSSAPSPRETISTLSPFLPPSPAS